MPMPAGAFPAARLRWAGRRGALAANLAALARPRAGIADHRRNQHRRLPELPRHLRRSGLGRPRPTTPPSWRWPAIPMRWSPMSRCCWRATPSARRRRDGSRRRATSRPSGRARPRAPPSCWWRPRPNTWCRNDCDTTCRCRGAFLLRACAPGRRAPRAAGRQPGGAGRPRRRSVRRLLGAGLRVPVRRQRPLQVPYDEASHRAYAAAPTSRCRASRYATILGNGPEANGMRFALAPRCAAAPCTRAGAWPWR